MPKLQGKRWRTSSDGMVKVSKSELQEFQPPKKEYQRSLDEIGKSKRAYERSELQKKLAKPKQVGEKQSQSTTRIVKKGLRAKFPKS